MRRTACRLVQVAARTSGSAEASAAPALVRSFASPPPAGEHHETPLSKFMPAVAKLPRQVVTTALSLASGAVTSAATSGTVKGWVTSFADKVVVSENVVALSDVDVPFWASWLSWAGYAQHGGFKKFAAAVTPKVAALSPAEVTDLTVAFHRAGYYDKDLFDAISANIQKSFVTYDTEQLLSVLGAFAQFGHYSEALYDDIADSITYANHYLAPLKQPAGAIATALSVYAKYDHERADLFTTLSRGLSELSIGKLSAAEQREVALKALRAFNHFQFWPENADALFYVARQQAAGFTADEAKEIAKYQTLAEDQAGGEIKFYDGSEDAGHWYGHHTHHAPQSYSLYVFRDSLVPKEYSPLSVRPWKQ